MGVAARWVKGMSPGLGVGTSFLLLSQAMPAASPDSNFVGLAEEQDAEVTPTADVVPLPVRGQKALVLAGEADGRGAVPEQSFPGGTRVRRAEKGQQLPRWRGVQLAEGAVSGYGPPWALSTFCPSFP